MGSVMLLPKDQLFANFFQHLLIVRIKLCLRIRSRFIFSVAKVSQNSSERLLTKWELKICHKCQQENISSCLTQSSTKQTSTHSLQIQHQITVVAFILVSDWDVHLMMPQV